MNGYGGGWYGGGRYGYYDWSRYAFLWPPHRRGLAPRWAVATAPSAPAVVEPITPAQLLQLARIVPGDEETALLPGYISAARQQCEQDTGRALVETVQDCYADHVPSDVPLYLPWPPLQSVDVLEWTDSDDITTPIDPASYIVDAASTPARIAWKHSTDAPSTVRSFYGWHLQQRVGYSPQTIPPLLTQAIGLLAAHWLTTGRDMAILGATVLEMPYGYKDAISPYRLEVLA